MHSWQNSVLELNTIINHNAQSVLGMTAPSALFSLYL